MASTGLRNVLFIQIDVDARKDLGSAEIRAGNTHDEATSGLFRSDNATEELFDEVVYKLVNAIQKNLNGINLNIANNTTIVRDPTFPVPNLDLHAEFAMRALAAKVIGPQAGGTPLAAAVARALAASGAERPPAPAAAEAGDLAAEEARDEPAAGEAGVDGPAGEQPAQAAGAEGAEGRKHAGKKGAAAKKAGSRSHKKAGGR